MIKGQEEEWEERRDKRSEGLSRKKRDRDKGSKEGAGGRGKREERREE